MSDRRVIGVDFDNTLISYDGLFHQIAVRRGLIPQETSRNKRTVRDALRRLPDGEDTWQEIQRLVYGTQIGQASLREGVPAFFAQCRARQIRVFIVSHKTEFPSGEEGGVNLRSAATEWMSRHQFFSPSGLQLGRSDVYFESSRQEKIARIAALGCTHFIDDLEETFLEASFPAGVEKILLSVDGQASPLPGVRNLTRWKEINDHLFGSGR